jgi:hypothetical protein
MKRINKRLALFAAAAFIICGGFILFSIIHYGVNTPVLDEWDMVPLFQKVDSHSLSFSALWAQHSEHRILFPNIVLLTSAYITHWNIRVELLLCFVFSIITALMLYLLVLSKIKQKRLAVLASILIAAWLYSPIQYRNWLLGWQIEWLICVAGVVSSVFFLDRLNESKNNARKILFVAAIASAMVGTYSLGDGMLIWPVGLCMLIFYKQTKKIIGTWAIASILAISAYYHNYHSPTTVPQASLFLHQPLNFIKYILGYIGGPISNQPRAAEVTGAVLILALLPLLYMVWLKRSTLSKFVPWLGLIALGLASSVITGVARLGFGVSEASISRYTTFSLLYVIGVTGLICTILDTGIIKRQMANKVIAMILGLAGLFLLFSYAYGIHGFQDQSLWLKNVAYCTHQSKPTNGCLLLTATYPQRDTKLVAKRLAYVKSKHWAGY